MEHEHVHAAETAFIEGFRAASDKQAFLTLARIPLELAAADGPGLKLVQVLLEDTVEVGRASRGFATRELVYQPLPARVRPVHRSLRPFLQVPHVRILGRGSRQRSNPRHYHRCRQPR